MQQTDFELFWPMLKKATTEDFEQVLCILDTHLS